MLGAFVTRIKRKRTKDTEEKSKGFLLASWSREERLANTSGTDGGWYQLYGNDKKKEARKEYLACTHLFVIGVVDQRFGCGSEIW
jgi:hypothetical protein